jgi:hypothetical protein
MAAPSIQNTEDFLKWMDSPEGQEQMNEIVQEMIAEQQEETDRLNAFKSTDRFEEVVSALATQECSYTCSYGYHKLPEGVTPEEVDTVCDWILNNIQGVEDEEAMFSTYNHSYGPIEVSIMFGQGSDIMVYADVK